MHVVLHHRPRLFVIDLRHLRHASPRTVRALFDAYRACGHVGGELQVINVAPALFHTLARAGVTRLFICRLLGPGAVSGGAPAARRSPAPRVLASGRLPRAVLSGRRCPARPAGPRMQVRPASTPPTGRAALDTPVPVLHRCAGRSVHGRATIRWVGSGRWSTGARADRLRPAGPGVLQACEPGTGHPRPPPKPASRSPAAAPRLLAVTIALVPTTPAVAFCLGSGRRRPGTAGSGNS
jgi:hypothetical protein